MPRNKPIGNQAISFAMTDAMINDLNALQPVGINRGNLVRKVIEHLNEVELLKIKNWEEPPRQRGLRRSKKYSVSDEAKAKVERLRDAGVPVLDLIRHGIAVYLSLPHDMLLRDESLLLDWKKQKVRRRQLRDRKARQTVNLKRAATETVANPILASMGITRDEYIRSLSIRMQRGELGQIDSEGLARRFGLTDVEIARVNELAADVHVGLSAPDRVGLDGFDPNALADEARSKLSKTAAAGVARAEDARKRQLAANRARLALEALGPFPNVNDEAAVRSWLEEAGKSLPKDEVDQLWRQFLAKKAERAPGPGPVRAAGMSEGTERRAPGRPKTTEKKQLARYMNGGVTDDREVEAPAVHSGTNVIQSLSDDVAVDMDREALKPNRTPCGHCKDDPPGSPPCKACGGSGFFEVKPTMSTADQAQADIEAQEDAKIFEAKPFKKIDGVDYPPEADVFPSEYGPITPGPGQVGAPFGDDGMVINAVTGPAPGAPLIYNDPEDGAMKGLAHRDATPRNMKPEQPERRYAMDVADNGYGYVRDETGRLIGRFVMPTTEYDSVLALPEAGIVELVSGGEKQIIGLEPVTDEERIMLGEALQDHAIYELITLELNEKFAMRGDEPITEGHMNELYTVVRNRIFKEIDAGNLEGFTKDEAEAVFARTMLRLRKDFNLPAFDLIDNGYGEPDETVTAIDPEFDAEAAFDTGDES